MGFHFGAHFLGHKKIGTLKFGRETSTTICTFFTGFFLNNFQLNSILFLEKLTSGSIL